MKLGTTFAASAAVIFALILLLAPDWDLPPVESEQIGYRGTGMVLNKDVEKQKELRIANEVPAPPWEPDPEGDKAGDIYENVQVLGDLSDDQFNQFMASITEWVAPEQGCAYCHNEENFALDDVYQKVVSRRMIQMNQAVNANWKDHVADVGVTCYTCHRGQPVPKNVWWFDNWPKPAGGDLGYRDGQDVVARFAGLTSLPQNALAYYLLGDRNINVHGNTVLPTGKETATTRDTEATWALMIHMSESLGANCTTCHNSRAFNEWDPSPPQRVTAWYGIRMTRALNKDYMVGLTPVFPENRLGPEGDVLKIGCSTCHNGVQKPLYGVSMLKDYLAALGQTTNTGVPDYTTYKPGETQKLEPAAPAASSTSSSVNENGAAKTQVVSAD
ncbi:photosynthetic reaction center cytochrome PufC [Roseibium sp. RKSG952]|uniref:photosynthetic reaction center cytochrome PufC n=1 Tax=Roseibium sp. RKSG952 TaxID=2529384 RepID=UPI0012BD1501|nr:photosynthetic reaction center cytochrome PufC [Roseibium sp. RKSG952]MTH98784.1 photosynthetic reaction center cytochrome c subunit [Roseibium sp. RKSG952]